MSAAVSSAVTVPAGRSSWPVTIAVAVAVTVVPVVALIVVSGEPGAPAGPPLWSLALPLLMLGLAVVLTRIRVELAVAVLSVALVTVFGPPYAVMAGAGVWQTIGGFGLFLGVCWVICCLGRRLALRWSILWVAGFVAAVVVGLDLDMAIAMLGVGWWLVGVSFRHSAELTARLRERTAELAAEQDRFADEAVRLERARIARELHDVVAHCMTVIVIQARAGRQLVSAPDTDAAAADEALESILATAREAENDLDALVGVMDPTTRPLTRDLLETLVRRAAAGGAEVRLELRGDPAVLGATQAAVAHRAVQEALTNALRHAPGAPVTVALDCEDGLSLRVTNAAGGGATATAGSGRGLTGLAERVAGLGGTAAWGPTTDGGWEVRVQLSSAKSVRRTEMRVR